MMTKKRSSVVPAPGSTQFVNICMFLFTDLFILTLTLKYLFKSSENHSTATIPFTLYLLMFHFYYVTCYLNSLVKSFYPVHFLITLPYVNKLIGFVHIFENSILFSLF